MQEIEKTVQEALFARQDLGYRAFHSRLMPTVDKEKIIGVRTPVLRAYAREFGKTDGASAFLSVLPHTYYEENNLHGFLIEQLRDYDACVAALDAFLPFVDNWATCDLCAPPVLGRHRAELLVPIRRWLAAGDTYTVRYAIELLMRWYLDDSFDPAYPAMVAAVQSEEYYINMMIAWYFATALAKQWAAVLPFLEEHRLADWTHNKAIQKAVESYRITPEQKAYLKTLKAKAERGTGTT